MNPVPTTAIVFICVFGGALIGMALRYVVPAHHLTSETKDVLKLGVGLIGTMSALVLGLLVASAKSSYDTRGNEITQIAASSVMLDRMLAHYGPETDELRGILRITLAQMIVQIWPEDSAGAGGMNSGPGKGEIIFDKLAELTPRNEAQRALQAQAQAVMINMGQNRWLLFEQNGTSISTPFLIVVVFWLSILFVSFGLFAPTNMTIVVTLLLSAVSVAGALFLILELDHPFTGLIQLSSAPMRNALAVLGK
jgi:hypothetical protein